MEEFISVMLLDIILLAYVILYCIRMAPTLRTSRVQYRISDIWAFSISLSPSLLMFANGWSATIALGLLLPHQIGGVVIWAFSRQLSPNHSEWLTAFHIVLGGLIGLLLPLVSGLIFAVFLIGLIASPIVVPLVAIGFVIKAMVQRTQHREDIRQLRDLEKIDAE